MRALSLASLQIRRTDTIWDIGAASGSVAIEASSLANEGQVYAIEVNEECLGYCRDNVKTQGADNVHVIAGRAPEALDNLPQPDAIFVGGSKGSLSEIIRYSIRRLSPGGRLVVNAVTMENIQEAYTIMQELKLDPDITQVQISRGVPLARFHRYEALNPIHIFSATKQEPSQ